MLIKIYPGNIAIITRQDRIFQIIKKAAEEIFKDFFSKVKKMPHDSKSISEEFKKELSQEFSWKLQRN